MEEPQWAAEAAGASGPDGSRGEVVAARGGSALGVGGSARRGVSHVKMKAGRRKRERRARSGWTVGSMSNGYRRWLREKLIFNLLPPRHFLCVLIIGIPK